MTYEQLKQARQNAGMTQVEAADRLGLSQPYLSQMERGERPVTAEVVKAAVAAYKLPASVLPVPDVPVSKQSVDPSTLAGQLASLGYPGFAHLRSKAKTNPATVLLEALSQDDLEVRLSEALPWVVLHYPDLNWAWLTKHTKLHDLQNRLGFVVSLASELAAKDADFQKAHEKLKGVQSQLERARLAREDTLCRESMPAAERRWLKENRPPAARYWNLLTSLSTDQLSYAS